MPNAQFYRLTGLPAYVLGEVDDKARKLRAAGKTVYDFGLGNPDRGSPADVVRRLVKEAPPSAHHRYAPSPGIAPLRQAICSWYDRRYGVKLDAETEAVATIGSKEGLGHLFLATVAPGDCVLVPDPCYPVHRFGVLFAGGEPVSVRTGPSFDPVKEYEETRVRSPKPPKMAIINFPHNPTTAVASQAQLEALVRWGEKHDMWLVSDLAYSDIVFGDERYSPSMLTIKGARERTCEFFTLSKSFNMAGWRVGFCVGNKDLVGALRRIKGYLDYGMFTPVQLAAVTALGNDGAAREIRDLYKARRDVLVEGLNRAGWPVEAPLASMFVWAPLPKKYESMGSVKFAVKLIDEAGVAVAPGVGFGEGGEGFVRFALVEEVDATKAACEAIARVLKG